MFVVNVLEVAPREQGASTFYVALIALGGIRVSSRSMEQGTYLQGSVGARDSTHGAGQELLGVSRVESSRVKRCSNSKDRVWSVPEVFKYHGSGRVTVN